MPRSRTWAGRSLIQHFPTAPSMVARHASRFLQSLVELECGVWKLSQVVHVFKDGDLADLDRYRPISLASCAFKVFERLIHGRIAPHICNRLDDSQEVSDGAQMLVCMGSSTRSSSARTPIHFAPSLTFGRLSTLHGMRQHSFVCTSPASLVACGAPLPTFSVGRSPTCEFEETSRLHGWTQGLHRGACFHLCCLISCAAAIRRASTGVRLVPSSDFRLTDQFYADDLVVLGAKLLQLALDAVTPWGRRWRFSFGIRTRPLKAVVQSSSCRHLGVVLTPSLHWDAHVAHIVSRCHRLFAQCVSWARSEGFSVSFWLHTSFPPRCNGADPCPLSAVCTPLHQEDALPSQRSTSSRGRLSWLSWCWSGLFSSCDPSMAASCGFFLFWTAHGSNALPVPLPSSRAFLSALLVWISPFTILTLTLDC